MFRDSLRLPRLRLLHPRNNNDYIKENITNIFVNDHSCLKSLFESENVTVVIEGDKQCVRIVGQSLFSVEQLISIERANNAIGSSKR